MMRFRRRGLQIERGEQDPDSVLPMFKRILKRAGLPELRFHDCRHTFCKIALANGVDFKTLSAMLGHYSVAFTVDIRNPNTIQQRKQPTV